MENNCLGVKHRDIRLTLLIKSVLSITTIPSLQPLYITLQQIFSLDLNWNATKDIKKIQKENGYDGIVETFKKTTNVTTLTAFTEDFVALLGIVLAFDGSVLTQYLGNPLYDAATSLVIGVLLMGVAVALA